MSRSYTSPPLSASMACSGTPYLTETIIPNNTSPRTELHQACAHMYSELHISLHISHLHAQIGREYSVQVQKYVILAVRRTH
jgi:hypothetical protein